MKLPTSSGLPKNPNIAKPTRLIIRRIVGDSMAPTLQHGQLVVFASSARRPVGVGDVVMFRHDGRDKIKRIARSELGRIYLLGDNPEGSTDSRTFGWVGAETVVGVLVWPRRSSKTI